MTRKYAPNSDSTAVEVASEKQSQGTARWFTTGPQP